MQRFDIRNYKASLRNKYKTIRRSLAKEQKADFDSAILDKLLSMAHYKNADCILTYVSTDIEVDTHELIKRALSDGKRVAVPYCIEDTRDMEFYFITSLDQLEKRTFGVLEPVASQETRLTGYNGSICIVPGLAFDAYGYRLGYGKGYYDRFLSRYGENVKIGLCYRSCITSSLRRGRFDVPCDLVITEGGARLSRR